MVIKRTHKILFWIAIFTCLVFSVKQALSTPSDKNSSSLVINEFLAANRTGLTDEDGDYSDWIEIYNQSKQAVNLSGWSLTDDPDQPEKWTFPNLKLGSRQYLVVFASGKNRKQNKPGSMLHTNFKLDKKGEFLALYNIFDDKLIDVTSSRFSEHFNDEHFNAEQFNAEHFSVEHFSVEHFSVEHFSDMSYGRYSQESTYGYLATPTPGQPNDETVVWLGRVEPVDFSLKRGFYDQPFTLTLNTATPGAAIRYTSDGSKPTETNGLLYSQPLAIDTTAFIRAIALKPGFLPSKTATHSYIFLADVLKQPPHPAGFPESWGTYGKDYGGFTKGSPVTADYEMDPEVVYDPHYKDTIKEDLKSIPSLSIVTEMQNYDIYGEPRLRGQAYERPVSVELIDPYGQREGFQIEAGLRIQGGWGRWEVVPKHSFRLFFKRKYGFPKLEYPFFPNSPVEKFDTLILRAGTDESYAGKPAPELDHRLDTYTRDEWLRASQIAMSGVGSHGNFAHLYLNGLYWGLYNVVERPDASFMSFYLGGQKEDWYAIKHGSTLIGPNQTRAGGEAISGSGERFERLQKLAGEGGLNRPEKYTTLKSYLDTAHFLDYIILAWYAGRSSNWTESNWYAGVRNPDGQVKHFIWDGEKTWSGGARVDFGRITGQPNLIKILFEALTQNPDCKMELADRMYRHLFNNGPLTDANSQARWKRINDPLERAIAGESARWGDAIAEPPLTRDDWLKARDDVLAQMDGNAAKLVALAREAGYYPHLDPPTFNQPGGLVTAGFNLTMATPNGIIYYTTDGSDPRLPVSGAVAPGAKIYLAPLVLTTTSHIKARVLADDPASLQTEGLKAEGLEQIWSALHEATFRVVEQDIQLRLTEIMYNPLDGGDYEFIELKNTGHSQLDLSGMSFTGLRFAFPAHTSPLAPGELVVLVRNPAAFAEKYPGVASGGSYQGQLSNTGETITLQDAKGRVVAAVTYDDENGWPVSPDGRGDSLVLIAPAGDPNNPKSWRASANLHGSPGADEPAP